MRFPGIVPAVTTPFDAAGEVDVAALERNVGVLLDAGVHGLVATGTMGEAGSLSAAERRVVVEAVVRAADGRVPVIAGISAGTPTAVLGFAATAADAGVDAGAARRGGRGPQPPPATRLPRRRGGARRVVPPDRSGGRIAGHALPQ